MVLTRSFVRAKRPCTDGFRWFVRQFNDGGHYQELLDQMVAGGRVGDACWLLEQFGPTDEVREVDTIDAEAIVFSGTLRVRGGVEVDGNTFVGLDLRGQDDIRTGEGLHAGDAIRAGDGYGVFAGLGVHMEAWEASARVSAPRTNPRA